MKVSINNREKLSELKNPFSFKGAPAKLNYGTIKNAQNAIEAWGYLRHADYLNVHSDNVSRINKEIHKKIRLENYSFLDKLTTSSDKDSFITAFCNFTGFPNLKLISEKMNKEFKKTIEYIDYYSSGYYKVIDWGYDPTCSLGQNKAFPGSDMDKAYVILKGSEYDSSKVSWFSGRLWNCLDQRLVSLNHPDTFPEIYTDQQVVMNLKLLDSYVRNLINQKVPPVASTFVRGVLKMFLKYRSPLDVHFPPSRITQKTIDFVEEKITYPNPVINKETNPKLAAKFNIDLAKTLPESLRELAKNFAFFIEIVKANYRRNPEGKDSELFDKIFDSDFAKYSNVTQVEAWQKKLDSGYMKTKLKNRMQLEKDFYKMTTEDKYDLIKDVIKSSSNDQCDVRFSHLFKNDDDIAERYKGLLSELK